MEIEKAMNKMIRWLANYSSTKPIQPTQASRQQAEEIHKKFAKCHPDKSS